MNKFEIIILSTIYTVLLINDKNADVNSMSSNMCRYG